MTEAINHIKQEGDALSKLIQLQAGRHGIQLHYTGVGVSDLIALCNAHARRDMLAKHLWDGMRELMQLSRKVPEEMQAQICSIILTAQLLVDLQTEERKKRMEMMHKPKGAA